MCACTHMCSHTHAHILARTSMTFLCDIPSKSTKIKLPLSVRKLECRQVLRIAEAKSRTRTPTLPSMCECSVFEEGWACEPFWYGCPVSVFLAATQHQGKAADAKNPSIIFFSPKKRAQEKLVFDKWFKTENIYFPFWTPGWCGVTLGLHAQIWVLSGEASCWHSVLCF